VRTLTQEIAQVDSVLSADGRRPVRRRKYTTSAIRSLVIMRSFAPLRMTRHRFVTVPQQTGLCYSFSALPSIGSGPGSNLSPSSK